MTVIRQRGFFYGYFLTFSGFLILFAMYGTLYSFGVFLRPLLNELGWTKASASGAYSLCFFLSGALAMGTGWLNDRIGPRIVISCSGLLIGLGYLFLSRMNTIMELYLYYGLLVGMGMSGGITPVLSTISRWFEKNRGLMTGFAVTGVGTGTLLMPSLTHALISVYGWRFSFLLQGIVVLAVIAGMAQFFLHDPIAKGLVPYGSDVTKRDLSDCEVTGFSFGMTYRSVHLWILLTIYVCSGFCIQVVLVHITTYAISSGASPTLGAVLLSVIGIGSITGRIFGGAASDRFGNSLMIFVSSILMAAQFCLLLLSDSRSILLLFAGSFGVVYGQILCMMPLLSADVFGVKNLGTILGIITFASTIGGSIGPVLAGALVDLFDHYRIVWITCAGVSLVCVFLSISLIKVDSNGRAMGKNMGCANPH